MTVENKSWFGRNWKWLLPVGCGGLFMFGCAMVVGILLIVMSAIKSSDAFTESMTRVRENPAAVTALGTPIEPGFFVSGQINVAGSTGTATLSIPVSGPKGKGIVETIGTKSGGVWTWSKMDVTIEGTKTPIELRPESEPQLEAVDK